MMPVLTGRPTTESPTFNPTTLSPTTDSPTGFDTSVCFSDAEGNYGFPTAPVVEVINFRYQIEATSTTTVDYLNDDALPTAEKRISDVLVPELFYRNGECDNAATSRSGTVTMEVEKPDGDTTMMQKMAMDVFKDKQKLKPQGSRTEGWEPAPGGNRLLRELQEENELVGLTAAPPDLVIRGRLQSK